MNDVNMACVAGRLVSDTKLEYSKSGKAYVKFSVACNRSVKNGDSWENKPDYFDVVLIGKSADNLAPYLVKGKFVVVAGRLQQSSWTDQQGQKHSKVGIVADIVELGKEPTAQKQETPPQEVFHDDDIPF